MFFHVLPFIFLRTIENEVRVKGTSSTSISAVQQAARISKGVMETFLLVILV